MAKIGINPITWSNDDMPELGGDTPLETCLSEAKLAGYDGMELGGKFPRDPAVLGPILDRHGLKLVSGWYSARLLERDAAAEIKALADHLRLLKTLGATTMVFAEVTGCVHGDIKAPLTARPKMTDAQWTVFAQRIGEVGKHLAAAGVHLTFHHHMGTVVETESEIDRLMSMTGPEVGLLLDTGHLTYAGGDPIAVAKRWGARINHVHCKDVRLAVLGRARSENWSFLESVLAGVFTVPGDGIVDYPAVLKAIAGLRYKGWLVVEAEQDPKKAHPLTYARMGHDYLRAQAAKAGL